MLSPYLNSFRLTSPQSDSRTVMGRTEPHHGIDLVGDTINIYAVKPGEVVVSIWTPPPNQATEFGNRIWIRDNDKNIACYNHLSERFARKGDFIRVGELIGIQGSTGRSTGSHLHFEIRDKLGASFKNFSAAEYLGIQNKAGRFTYVALPVIDEHDYQALVAAKCGLSREMVAYISRYKFAVTLWESLWETMKSYPKRTSGSYGKDYATAVARACDLEPQTIAYLWKCPNAADMFRLLWWQMT